MADDRRIVDKCIARDESALEELRTQYGSFLQRLAERILGSREDAEECVSDTLLKVWNSIPPEEPQHHADAAFARSVAHGDLRDRVQIPEAPYENVPLLRRQGFYESIHRLNQAFCLQRLLRSGLRGSDFRQVIPDQRPDPAAALGRLPRF